MTTKNTDEPQKQELEQAPKAVANDILWHNSGTAMKFIEPLQMIWQPKEDITTYELAKCLPYLLHNNMVMPCHIDQSEKHFRHFKIIDRNK